MLAYGATAEAPRTLPWLGGRLLAGRKTAARRNTMLLGGTTIFAEVRSRLDRAPRVG